MHPAAFSRRHAGLVLVLLVAVACGGGSSPATPPTTSPSTTVSSGPSPTPPPAASGCPLGYGSGRFTCQGDSPGLLPSLNTAIDKTVAQRPDLFDTDNPPAEGAYLVRNTEAFYTALLANLQAAGMCGQLDEGHERISIKENNSYSENYDIMTAQSRLQRTEKAYLVSCTPANFPLTQSAAVASVAVSFFRQNCDGVTVPFPGLNMLQIGCIGTITATPRDSIGQKLPLDQHGLDIQWYFRAGEGSVVAASPDDEIPFNVRLYPRTIGEFSICAVVQEKTGCLNGFVVP